MTKDAAELTAAAYSSIAVVSGLVFGFALLWVHLIAATDASPVLAKPIAELAKRSPPFDGYHMHKEHLQHFQGHLLYTSPHWSQARRFTRAVMRSKRGGPPSLQNVTLKYLLFTPLIATGPDPGTGAPARRLPLLCYLHGYRTPPRPDALGVFTDETHQKRLPLFVLQPSMLQTSSSDWADRVRFDSVHRRFHISSHAARLTPSQNVLLALLDQLLGELPVVDPRQVSK